MNKMLEIRKAVEELSTDDVRQALKLVMLQIEIAEQSLEAREDLFNNLKELYDSLLNSQNNNKRELDSAVTKIHIVFGDSVAGSLKLAIKQLGLADSNKVITLNESFSIGPIWQLHKEEGWLKRKEWFRNNINVGYDESYFDMEEEASSHQSLLAQIPEQASIVIWCGNNAHEQTGLRYALYLLRHHLNRIYVFNAEEACSRRYNTPETFINYLQLGEVPVDKLKAVIGEAEENGQTTGDIRQQLEREWLALAEHDEVLRIWNESKIQHVDEDYLDDYLFETVESLLQHKPKDEFIKAARVVGQALGYYEQCIGDSYFEYRLRCLVYAGKLEIKGVPRAMRFYSVRLK